MALLDGYGTRLHSEESVGPSVDGRGAVEHEADAARIRILQTSDPISIQRVNMKKQASPPLRWPVLRSEHESVLRQPNSVTVVSRTQT